MLPVTTSILNQKYASFDSVTDLYSKLNYLIFMNSNRLYLYNFKPI